MNSAGTLSRNEVRRISSRAIRGYDKWHRMWAGIASELERYEENIMYLRIENTEKTWPSNHQTAESNLHVTAFDKDNKFLAVYRFEVKEGNIAPITDWAPFL